VKELLLAQISSVSSVVACHHSLRPHPAQCWQALYIIQIEGSQTKSGFQIDHVTGRRYAMETSPAITCIDLDCRAQLIHSSRLSSNTQPNRMQALFKVQKYYDFSTVQIRRKLRLSKTCGYSRWATRTLWSITCMEN
jgi:hypothetical protein